MTASKQSGEELNRKIKAREGWLESRAWGRAQGEDKGREVCKAQPPIYYSSFHFLFHYPYKPPIYYSSFHFLKATDQLPQHIEHYYENVSAGVRAREHRTNAINRLFAKKGDKYVLNTGDAMFRNAQAVYDHQLTGRKSWDYLSPSWEEKAKCPGFAGIRKPFCFFICSLGEDY